MANSSRCNEPNCSAVFHHIKSLRNHLVLVHKQTHYEETFDFNSEEEYNSWKTDYEIQHSVRFVFKYINNSKDVKYFFCNRSGHYTSKRAKKQLSLNAMKINDNCTCTLKVTHGIFIIIIVVYTV